MSEIKVGYVVRVKLEHQRTETSLFAKEAFTGEVMELFCPTTSTADVFANVRCENKIYVLPVAFLDLVYPKLPSK
jgi:hypothetical protein